MKKETVNKSVLLLLVMFISALFLSMIRNFLMAIFLAGDIFGPGLSHVQAFHQVVRRQACPGIRV